MPLIFGILEEGTIPCFTILRELVAGVLVLLDSVCGLTRTVFLDWASVPLVEANTRKAISKIFFILTWFL